MAPAEKPRPTEAAKSVDARFSGAHSMSPGHPAPVDKVPVVPAEPRRRRSNARMLAMLAMLAVLAALIAALLWWILG